MSGKHFSITLATLALAVALVTAGRPALAQGEQLPLPAPDRPAAGARPQVLYNNLGVPGAVGALDVLYDQLAGVLPSAQAYSSQEFTDWPSYNRQLADDFTFTGTDYWIINTVEVKGQLTTEGVQAVNVYFYTNSSSNLPETQVFFQAATSVIGTESGNGNFVVTLNPSAFLAPGTYWVSVQAKKTNISGQWYWKTRDSIAGYPASFRRATGADCTSWSPPAGCLAPVPTGDLAFSLSGSTLDPATLTNFVYLPLVRR